MTPDPRHLTKADKRKLREIIACCYQSGNWGWLYRFIEAHARNTDKAQVWSVDDPYERGWQDGYAAAGSDNHAVNQLNRILR